MSFVDEMICFDMPAGMYDESSFLIENAFKGQIENIQEL